MKKLKIYKNKNLKCEKQFDNPSSIATRGYKVQVNSVKQ